MTAYRISRLKHLGTLGMWTTERNAPWGSAPDAHEGTDAREATLLYAGMDHGEGVSPERKLMTAVAVIGNTGKPLMPTSPYRARRLLKSGRAKIYGYRPFTIMILDREDGAVQEIEYKSDTGYLHVGISVCSKKHEFLREQRDLLPDEREKHNDRRKYRRTRRNRKRYRKPRFDNRIGKSRKAEKEGGVWLPPSLEHKVDAQLRLFTQACRIMPISSAAFEMGKFDPACLKAEESGGPVPQGVDYQHGGRYQAATIRAAVFARDGHTCLFCGRGIKDGAFLHVHHIGYWKKDRSNRLGNLATCCGMCHTSENHKPGGILYGKQPEVSGLAPATYMNTVRFELLRRLKGSAPAVDIHISYGARTSMVRKERAIIKSHTNDAYCLGRFFPKHRASEEVFQKTRRNSRILQKFYDAVYIDGRTGEEAKGQELTNGRISRNHKKDHKNLHPFRSRKVSKGRVTIRRSRTALKPGSLVEFNDEVLTVHGTHTSRYKSKKTGKTAVSINIEFEQPARNGKKSAALSKCRIINKSYNTGWKKITASALK